MSLSVVQSTSGAGAFLTALSTANFAAVVTAGNAIIVGVLTGAGAADVTSVTDTHGNTYTKLYTQIDTGDLIDVEVWACLSLTTGGTNAITAHDSSSNLVGVIAYEVSGLAASPQDGSGGANNNSTTTTTVSVTTANANDLLIMFAGASTTGSWTKDATFTNLVTTNNNQAFMGQTKIVSSTGTQSSTCTFSVSGYGEAAIIGAFKGASTGNPGSNTQTAIARIQKTLTKTQSGKARIQSTVTKTQTAIAHIAISRSATQTAIARIGVINTKTQSGITRIQSAPTAVQTGVASIIHVSSISTTGIARIIANPPVKKSYIYKVYDANGVYLGMLPQPKSDFSYAQDINTAGTQIQIDIPVSPDTSLLPGINPLQDEDGTSFTDEQGNTLTTEGAINLVGTGSDTTLVKNGNGVVIIEVSQYYPNGHIVFQGQMQRWEAQFGGSNMEDLVSVIAYSDGQDLDNFILQGSPYVADQAQTTQNSSVLITSNSKSGAVQGAGQTFTTASGVTNTAALDVMLSGNSSQVKVTLWNSVSDANNNGMPLGSVTQSVNAGTPTVIKFAFSSPIHVSASTQYFMTVQELAGGNVYVYYMNSNVYSGGDMYRQNYGGGGGDALFHLTPFSDVTVLSDLYFESYSSAGATTATFTSVDPSTGMVETIMSNYHNQGGKITYDGSTVDATGLSLSYTFNTATVYEGIKKALDLSPDGFYYYVDIGTDMLHFKQTANTPDFILTKGKHLESINIIATIENIKNTLYFSGATVSGTNLFYVYKNQDSINKYGARVDRQSDNRVTVKATADAIGTSYVAENEAEQYQTVVTVVDGTMDISLIKPGHVIGFNGFGTFVDNLLSQVVRVEKTPDEVTLTLGILPPRLHPAFEKVVRGLVALETVSNPSTPS